MKLIDKVMIEQADEIKKRLIINACPHEFDEKNIDDKRVCSWEDIPEKCEECWDQEVD